MRPGYEAVVGRKTLIGLAAVRWLLLVQSAEAWLWVLVGSFGDREPSSLLSMDTSQRARQGWDEQL